MAGFGIGPRDLRKLVEERKEEPKFEARLARIGGVGGVAGLEAALKTDRQNGILEDSDEALDARREHFGVNEIKSKPPATYLELVWEALHDATLIMLIIAGIVSLILGLTVEDPDTGWIEGCAIMVSVAVVANVTAGNDWLKEKQFQKLNAQVENEDLDVIRAGKQIKVPSAELLVGDKVLLSEGNKIYADGFLVVAESLEVDESSQTGESALVNKTTDGKRIMLSGTTVKGGTGVMIVVAVGRHSQAGVISELILKSKGLAVDDDEGDDDIPELAVPVPASAVDPTAVDVVVEEVKGSAPDAAAAAGTAAADAVAGAAKDAVDGGADGDGDGDDDEEGHSGRSVLATKLDVLAVQIGKGGGLVAVFCVIVMVIVWCFAEFHDEFCGDSCDWESDEHPSELLGFFITGVTILVVAVPEGLPLAVTLSLAFSGYRMLKHKNLVRHLYACETMGSATTICTDKTGTLTTNIMTVRKIVVAGKALDARKSTNAPLAPGVEPALPDDFFHGPIAEASDLLWNLALNMGLNSRKNTRLEVVDGVQQKFGNPTEGAMIAFIRRLNPAYDYAKIRSTEAFSYEEPTREFPFSSATKWSGMVIPPSGTAIPAPGMAGSPEAERHEAAMKSSADAGSGAGAGAGAGAAGSGSPYRLLSKGAPEKVIDACTHVYWLADGASSVERVPLTPDMVKQVKAHQAEFAADGFRTLALSCKDLSAEEAANLDDLTAEVNQGSTLLGVVAIQDPIRPEVPDAIATCKRAGVGVIMCTGDHITTAKSIAAECGILEKNDQVYQAMTGEDFRERVLDADGNLDQAEFDKIWPTLRVLARCSPTDKFNLVSGLQNSNLFEVYRKDPSALPVPIYPDRQVIAVTGDGTNDAPALSRADVGFAMGKAGTAVARAACDIVLTDDNFASIVTACKWGRNVYDSVAKFIQFQLTVNISAICVAAVGALSIQESPLSAVQLLWVNLIMDSFASLALATEPPSDNLLTRPPYGKNRPIISRQMWFNMLGHALYQLVVLFPLVYKGEDFFDIPNGRQRDHDAPPTVHYTIVFNTFVLMQIFNEINARKLYAEWNVFEGIHRNPLYLAIVIFTLVAQVIIVEFGGRAFKTEGLNTKQWLWCLLLGFLVLPWQFVVNAASRVLPQTWLAPTDYTAVPKPIKAASPKARTPGGGTFSAANAVVRFLRSRTNARATVNRKFEDDFALTRDAEVRRERRASQVGIELEVSRRRSALRAGTAPPKMEGGFFALAEAANKNGELDELTRVAEEDEKKAEQIVLTQTEPSA